MAKELVELHYPPMLPENVETEVTDTKIKGVRLTYKTPRYPTPESFAAACEDYFATCASRGKRPTKSGLSLHLGFSDNRTLHSYKDRPDYAYIAERASLMVEYGYEEALMTKNYAGAIFALKQMGWFDTPQRKDADSGVKVEFKVTFTDKDKPQIIDV